MLYFVTFCMITIVSQNIGKNIFGPSSPDWPTFAGDPSHSGFKDVRLDVVSSRLLWSSSIVPQTYATIFNDYYMTMSSVGVIILNATTGNPIYVIPIPNTNYDPSTPIFAFDREIIGYSSNNITTSAYLDNSNSYQESWSFSETMGFLFSNQYGVTPSDTHNIIYISGGYYNSNMYAVNATNGQLLFTVYSGPDGCYQWTPTVYNGRVFINNCDPNSVSFFTEINATEYNYIAWRVYLNTPKSWYTQNWVPAISNNIAVVRSNRTNYNTTTEMYQYSAVAAIDINTHDLLWSQFCQESPQMPSISMLQDYSAANDGKYAYVSCHDIGVKSFDLFTGKLERIYPCQEDEEDVCIGQPLITENAVIVNSVKGAKIFNKRTGKMIKTLPFPGMPTLFVNGSQKILYLNHQNGSYGGGIYAYSFK